MYSCVKAFAEPSDRMGRTYVCAGGSDRRSLRCGRDDACSYVRKRSEIRTIWWGGRMFVHVEVFADPYDMGRTTHVFVRESVRRSLR